MQSLVYFILSCLIWVSSNAQVTKPPERDKSIVARETAVWNSMVCIYGDTEDRCQITSKKYECPDFSTDQMVYAIATRLNNEETVTSVRYCRQKVAHRLIEDKQNPLVTMQKEFREKKCASNEVELICTSGLPTQMAKPSNAKCDKLDKAFRQQPGGIAIGTKPGITITRYCKNKS